MKATDSTYAAFEISGRGAIRHWLVAGPKESPYAGPPGPDHVLRKEALDYATATPPAQAKLGAEGPFGQPWSFHDPGRNEFVEFSSFYQELTLVEYFAFTEIEVPAREGDAEALWPTHFWAAGAADLWLDEKHVTRLNVTRYRNPDFVRVVLPLAPGIHRLCVRLQVLGIRDTRLLFGVFLQETRGVKVRMAGATQIAAALRWIDGVRPEAGGLRSEEPAPLSAKVKPFQAEPIVWRKGETNASFQGVRPFAVTVEAEIEGTTLQRTFEIPRHRQPAVKFTGDRRLAHLRYVAKAGLGGETPAGWNSQILPLLARRVLGEESSNDATAFRRTIGLIDARRDCADFGLAALLRLEILGLSTKEESAEIRRAALAFRYWMDEPGNDAMCFHSENHSLLFHGCQWLAGNLYPDEVFANSGRTGRAQAALARTRVADWLQQVEKRGFEEFNSGTYIPITIAAMLNVVDFARDAELSQRMAAQIDRIYKDLAQHAFADGVISPQGRIYRDVLFPEEMGTQALLALATEVTNVDLAGPRPPRERTADWVVFPATSPAYHPPADLSSLVSGPMARTYRHGDAQIILEKTPAYLLTSLAVPAIPREGEQPATDLRPGGAGYQQHLWQATLGWDCHIFVNHPGGFFDGTKSRPGYWYGSGLLPRVRQEGRWLQAIHVIADGTKTKPEIAPDVWEWPATSTVRPFDLHPIDFTHLHWPADEFDQELRQGNWVFGRKGRGLVGVWCSESLVPHDDILTGRELRANGYSSAWLVICGDLGEEGSLEAFAIQCQARAPQFDRANFILGMNGATPTRWWERSEPLPE